MRSITMPLLPHYSLFRVPPVPLFLAPDLPHVAYTTSQLTSTGSASQQWARRPRLLLSVATTWTTVPVPSLRRCQTEGPLSRWRLSVHCWPSRMPSERFVMSLSQHRKPYITVWWSDSCIETCRLSIRTSNASATGIYVPVTATTTTPTYGPNLTVENAVWGSSSEPPFGRLNMLKTRFEKLSQWLLIDGQVIPLRCQS
jgi:hypothetical protein